MSRNRWRILMAVGTLLLAVGGTVAVAKGRAPKADACCAADAKATGDKPAAAAEQSKLPPGHPDISNLPAGHPDISGLPAGHPEISSKQAAAGLECPYMKSQAEGKSSKGGKL